LCAASAFGPWSAATVSRKNQTERLNGLIDTLGLRPTSSRDDSKKEHTLTSKDYTNLHKTIQYLSERHGAQALQPIFPEVFTNNQDDKGRTSSWNIANTILKTHGVVIAGNSRYFHFELAQKEGISIDGFSKLVIFENIRNSEKKWKGGLSIHHAQKELRMGFSNSSPGQQVPLSELLQSLAKKSEGDLKADDLQADWQQEGRQFRIIFTSLNLLFEEMTAPSISSCSFVILEK